VIRRQPEFLRNGFQRQGNAWQKEQLLTFREEEEGGRDRVTISEEQVDMKVEWW